MHPILFTIPIPGTSLQLPVPAYGSVAVIAAILGFYLFMKSPQMQGRDPDLVLLVAVEILTIGLLGSALGNGVLILLGQGSTTASSGWTTFSRGLAWQGAILLVVSLGIWFIRYVNFPIRQTLDALAIPIFVGYTIGRFGCLLAGCCYGSRTSLPWGLVYPPGNPFGGAPPGIPLHPTPLYSIIGSALAIFALIKIRPYLKRDGHFFLAALSLNSLVRLFVEFARGDHDPLMGIVSVQQLFALACIVVSVGLIAKNKDLQFSDHR